jgi:hypothetical protein
MIFTQMKDLFNEKVLGCFGAIVLSCVKKFERIRVFWLKDLILSVLKESLEFKEFFAIQYLAQGGRMVWERS